MRDLTYYLCFLPVIISITACSHKKRAGNVTDTVAKHVSTVSRSDSAAYTRESLRAEDTTRKDEQGNYDYSQLTYPVFKSLQALNREIEKAMLNSLGDEKPDKQSFKSYFNGYQKSFAGAADTSETIYFRPSTLDLNIGVALQAANIVVLIIAEEISGGVHPNSNTSYLNWDTKTDRLITLNDLFINNYESRLNKIAEKIFRKNAGLGSGQALSNYHFENDTFALNNNFEITAKGLFFLYNSYEIQAYAYGPTELLIPYPSIKHLLRPNTVLTQFIK